MALALNDAQVQEAVFPPFDAMTPNLLPSKSFAAHRFPFEPVPLGMSQNRDILFWLAVFWSPFKTVSPQKIATAKTTPQDPVLFAYRPFAEMNMFDFPLLVLGIDFTTGHIFSHFVEGATEGHVMSCAGDRGAEEAHHKLHEGGERPDLKRTRLRRRRLRSSDGFGPLGGSSRGVQSSKLIWSKNGRFLGLVGGSCSTARAKTTTMGSS